MIWTLHRWVWRLESPLFIGMSPAGSLSRCRLYLPARTLHGALVAEIARSRCGVSFPDYGKIGWELALNCRFTYLYPAEKNGDEFLAWMPKYEKANGLRWYFQDDKKDLSDRDFRRRLLNSLSGTAIAPETDSAYEGTLRETECINPWWCDPSDPQAEPKPVFLLGYVFLRNNGFRRQLSNIDRLFVGGDTRYGLGKICLVQWDDLTDDSLILGKPANLANEHPGILSDSVWGHVPTGNHALINEMRGTKELLGGWEVANPWKGCLTWAPGSSLKGQALWTIDNYGYWIYQGPCDL